ncbi:MAG TPA: 23S rRNA (guanosine(2251)-2'-O)-methyltransferase RlmB [Acidimicrobiales bacterium]|nr:23S rRNA (guanosine(2251)-2'-O)-methyltransferase RlmB [Acidimicrobiales bacterium]
MPRRPGERPAPRGRRPSPPPGRRHRPERGLGGEQVEGRRAVEELLAARRRRVHQLLVAEGLEPAPVLEHILALASSQRVPVRWLGRTRLDAEALTDSHQGVLARAEPLPEADLEALAGGGDLPFLVVVEGVTDPHNLGAIIRTAEFAGASGMVLARHGAARITPAVAKAAAGSIEHLPLSLVPRIPSALQELGRAGVWTVGLDADARAPLFGLELADRPLALVLGSEGRGLSRLARQRCDVLVSIPRRGRTESLNVSAAAAVACFEVARRRG